MSIARRVVVDQIRRNQAWPRTTSQVDLEGLLDTPHNVARFEDVIEVRMLLDGLEPDRRDALVLTQVLGLSPTTKPPRFAAARWGPSARGWLAHAAT